MLSLNAFPVTHQKKPLNLYRTTSICAQYPTIPTSFQCTIYLTEIRYLPRLTRLFLKRCHGTIMLENYIPILLFILVGLLVGLGPVLMGFLVGPHKPDEEKDSPYECGFEAFENARMKFDIRYYLVAILFIIFDLEIAFLFPWAIVLQDLGWYGFSVMSIFLGILVVGFAYEWKKGALEWE